MTTIERVFLLGMTVFFLAACKGKLIAEPAAPVMPANMPRHSGSVYITLTGSTLREGTFSNMNRIADGTWLALIKKSIHDSRLFSRVYAEPGADYVLNVSPYKVPDGPEFHFNIFSKMTLEMESEWTLTNDVTGKVVMKKIIKTTHSGGEDHADAVSKIKVVRHGLVEKNIKEGLLAISVLDLR